MLMLRLVCPGYGDVSCQTVLGKMFLVLFILVGLVSITVQANIDLSAAAL